MDHFLDTRKLLCPLPLLRTQTKLKDLKPGETLEILASDPGVLYDIPVFCKMEGLIVLETLQTKWEIKIKIAVPDDGVRSEHLTF